MTSTWRSHAAHAIREVITRVGLEDQKALRKALRDAYPFGERKYHPYKVWLSEVKRQTKGRVMRKKPVRNHQNKPVYNMTIDLFEGLSDA